MHRPVAVLLFVVGLTAGATGATAHELDHPVEGFAPQGPISTNFISGGEGAEWRLHTTVVTGNPHTDIDFFRQGGEIYLSAGTLGTGANAGGQTIVQLTNGGEVDPAFVAGHPSASCVSDPSAALGLQHDIEATPKGDVLLNADWGPHADRRDAQLLIDATDAEGRCHDQGSLGLAGNPAGGLEIIDVTDVAEPVEIGLTSHIGEAHTVNVAPNRPHIAYVSGSDRVTIDEDGGRSNEDPEGSPNALDGFEVVDLSSCMDFPAGTTVEAKREGCRPEVYRVRFELGWTRGTFASANQAACHELELHPGDILTCAGVDGTLVLDMSGAFDGRGRPKGDPLPCAVRESASSPPFATGAMVTDCVVGEDDQDLSVPGWLEIGAPTLKGVKLVGFVNHGGREVSNNAVSHTPDEDVAVSHEAELTHSGRYLIVTDERGGAVVPPDASCPTPAVQPRNGNGGLHAFDMSKLFTEYPAVTGEDGAIDEAATAEAAREAYARAPGPDGGPAIVRADPLIPAESQCTSHVFQQIPGQNRIFMGWYTQGTQVFDYVEHADGTFEWIPTAFFIPENANSWVSHVFHVQENDDGTFTYWGASADFTLTGHGRNSIDIYEVTLPAPKQFAADAGPAGRGGPPAGKGKAQGGPGADRPRSAGAAQAATLTWASSPDAPTKVIDLRDPSLIGGRAHGPLSSAAARLGVQLGVPVLAAGLLLGLRRRRRPA